MIEINLLPNQLRPRTRLVTKKDPVLAPIPKAFPLGLGGVMLLMVVLILASGARVSASERKSRQVEHDLKLAKAQAARAETITEEFPALADRYAVLASRLDGKVHWADVLRVVSQRCPEGVIITKLELVPSRRRDQPGTFVIRGAYSGSNSLEMRFANGLKESATFTETFEAVIPEKNLMPDDRISFAISCLFRPFADPLIDGTDHEVAPR